MIKEEASEDRSQKKNKRGHALYSAGFFFSSELLLPTIYKHTKLYHEKFISSPKCQDPHRCDFHMEKFIFDTF